jgi:superfamily II DNA helicase RecQ
LREPQRPWPGLDYLGAIQAGGGLILGLIALFSSYDHITAFGRSIGLQQQWGIPLIAASVATIFIDAQLATRSRLRAAQDAERMADEAARERDLAREERQRANRSENEANRERNRADQERNRAAEARERQAETAKRQRKSFERLDQAALLSARVQLDPSPTNRARLRAFLTLMGQGLLDDGDAGMA